MCILFLKLLWRPQPGGYRLILVANRDESLRRPTVKAHRWEDAPDVLGGRDLEPGRERGTWLGINTAGKGRIAALLSVMGAGTTPQRRNRGFLAADLLRSNESVTDYLERVKRKAPEYNPFHLVGIDLDPSRGGLWHISNVSEGNNVDKHVTQVTHIKEGCFSLGNSPLTRPFKKVLAGEERFQECVRKWGRHCDTRDHLVEELVQLLKWNKEHYPDDEMEARGIASKASPDSRRRSSAIFQYLPEKVYGTRTHTVMLVDSNWRCDFHEWTKAEPVDPHSKWIHTHEVVQLNGETNGAAFSEK